MKAIEDLFVPHRARSGLFSDYGPGAVAYVGNGLGDNGVAGYVTPLAHDKVFRFRALVISAFCEASVQVPPFVACGRAGNGLVVLEPRLAMEARQLAYIAAYVNRSVRWRFNWYRQVTLDRLRRLLVPENVPEDVSFHVGSWLPPLKELIPVKWRPRLHSFPLDDILDLAPGNYHSLSALKSGSVPIVSCGDQNNGIAGYFDVDDHIFDHRLTIALNGSPLATKFHPYRFAAKDDVALCLPKQPLRLTTLLFLEVMLNLERWRYSYYRKCYLDKLRRFRIPLPVNGSGIDEDTIQKVVEASPYWPFLNARLQPPELPG